MQKRYNQNQRNQSKVFEIDSSARKRFILSLFFILVFHLSLSPFDQTRFLNPWHTYTHIQNDFQRLRKFEHALFRTIPVFSDSGEPVSPTSFEARRCFRQPHPRKNVKIIKTWTCVIYGKKSFSCPTPTVSLVIISWKEIMVKTSTRQYMFHMPILYEPTPTDFAGRTSMTKRSHVSKSENIIEK